MATFEAPKRSKTPNLKPSNPPQTNPIGARKERIKNLAGYAGEKKSGHPPQKITNKKVRNAPPDRALPAG